MPRRWSCCRPRRCHMTQFRFQSPAKQSMGRRSNTPRWSMIDSRRALDSKTKSSSSHHWSSGCTRSRPYIICAPFLQTYTTSIPPSPFLLSLLFPCLSCPLLLPLLISRFWSLDLRQGFLVVCSPEENGIWNWVFVGGTPSTLPLIGDGDGSADEMRECAVANSQEMLYGLLRLGFGSGRLGEDEICFRARHRSAVSP